jgi:cytochrome c2
MKHSLIFAAIAWGIGVGATALSASTELTLHSARNSPQDLAVTGKLRGVPAGETRYVRWVDLRNLPAREMVMSDQLMPGKQTVLLIMLNEVLRALPTALDADGIIATCTDGYASIYTETFIGRYKPFLILELNGIKAEQWPPAGMAYNPGPYVIGVADEVVAGVGQLMDVGHKRPWGVNALEIVNYRERFRSLYGGNLQSASNEVNEGREIWINSCFSCHNIPNEKLGGVKGSRPIQIIAAQAIYNKDYFRTYVREPKKANPAATMEPHPHYSDEQLEALTAFLKQMTEQPVP